MKEFSKIYWTKKRIWSKWKGTSQSKCSRISNSEKTLIELSWWMTQTAPLSWLKMTSTSAFKKKTQALWRTSSQVCLSNFKMLKSRRQPSFKWKPKKRNQLTRSSRTLRIWKTSGKKLTSKRTNLMSSKGMSSSLQRRLSSTRCKKRLISRLWTMRQAKWCSSEQSLKRRRRKWLFRLINATKNLFTSKTKTIRFSSCSQKSLGLSRREGRLMRLSKLCKRGLRRWRLPMMKSKSSTTRSRWRRLLSI